MEEPKIGDVRIIHHRKQVYFACPICGIPRWRETRDGIIQSPRHRKCYMARKQTLQERRNQSIAQIKKWSNPESRNRQSVAQLNRYSKPEERQKKHDMLVEIYKNPINRDIQSVAQFNRFRNPEELEKLRVAQLIRFQDPKECKKLSDIHQKQWADPIFRDGALKAMHSNNRQSPNIPETIILKVLTKYFPNEWDFIGDWQVEINNLYPDFKHKTNNWLIEHFGSYTHTALVKRPDQTEQGRIEAFAKVGYKTLILWEKFVKKQSDETIAEKIREYFYS